MSRSITATQLRVELRDLLSTIEDGPIEITKHGKVVAVLVAPSEARDPATHCTSHDAASELSYPEAVPPGLCPLRGSLGTAPAPTSGNGTA